MKKVAIVNRINFNNFGSILQCYALQETVRTFEYEPIVLWQRGTMMKYFDVRVGKLFMSLFRLLRHPRTLLQTVTSLCSLGNMSISDGSQKAFEAFRTEYMKSEKYPYRKLKQMAGSADYAAFVCGSDQVWSSTTMYVDPLSYLRFVPYEKRISYAPSLGRNFIPDYNKKRMKRYISGIRFLSVRELSGKRLIKDLAGKDAELVLDPTFLLPAERWLEIAKYPAQVNYILSYFLDEPSEETKCTLSELAVKYQCRIVALPYINVKPCDTSDIIYPDAGPLEFIGLIKNAAIVCTDSYHGTIFSMIMNTPFLIFERDYKDVPQSTRIETLIELFHIKDRYVTQSNNSFPNDITAYDFENVNEVLKLQKEKSLSFLKNAIRAIDSGNKNIQRIDL